MPQIDIPTGAPTWVDIASNDQAGTLAFYSELLGWEHETPNEQLGGYANFLRDGERIAGSMPAMEGMPTAWTVHFRTEDAEKSSEVATSHGGQVYAPAMAVMDLGDLAVLGDPGGSAFGVWKPGTHTGFPWLEEPGAPGWFELMTREYDAVLPFYRDVFGWQLETVYDGPEMRYSTASLGGRQICGLMDAANFLDDIPCQWMVYFDVADVDDACSRATGLGAVIRDEPQDTPYGRLAVLVDPQGAVVKLRQP